MKQTFILSLLVAACLTAACSSDSENEEPKTERHPIIVEVSENPMKTADAKQAPSTRAGSQITTASFNNFSLSYYYGDSFNTGTYTKNGSGDWTAKNMAWPYDYNQKLNFYAYNVGTINDGSNPYVSFAVEGNVAAQKDLLVATHPNISYNDDNGKVSLAFDHACAAVKFTVSKTSSLAEKTIVVTSVLLKNVQKTADYYYSNGWVINEIDKTDYDLTTAALPEITTTKLDLPCGYLFLIPQSKEDVTLTINYTVNGGASLTKNFNLTGTWEAGHEYTINISMGTSFIS